MNEIMVGWIEKDLKKYKQNIECLDENFDKIKIFDKYMAGDLIIYKYEISFLINHLEKENVDLTGPKNEYEDINKKFMAFMQKRGKAYRDKLYEELEYFVDDYTTKICFFLELDPIDIETGNDLEARDTIEFLLKELENEYDLHDMKVKVATLDDVLRCKFKTNIDTIMKECSLIEGEYYPENFWWRHPSKLLND